MEARIAHLESEVTRLLSYVKDIKADVRNLHHRIDGLDTKLSRRIDACARPEDKFDSLCATLDQLRDSLAAAKVWGLFLYILFAAINLGALARGLGWI